MNWKMIQDRLHEMGFNPGPRDGIYGRLTKAAVERFQRAFNVNVKWYGTVGPKTLAALFVHEAGVNAPKPDVGIVDRPWLDLAIRKMGLHESRDNAELKAFLKSDGATLGDPAQLPWCGDFVETCIAVTLPNERIITNPYLARNWLKFGFEIGPIVGAVMVFWRGSRNGISGHVAFAIGQNTGVYYVLGGNQSDRVSVTSISKDRFLGARWPATSSPPAKQHLPTMSGGQISLNEL